MGFYLLSYFCIMVFILAAIFLVYRQATLPAHLRWEIYPVQHETPARAAYGGSYLEEINWWEQREERSLFNEVRYMVPEILLIRGLWKENRPLWRISFPFHFGLYLMIAAFGLLILHALVMLWTDYPAGSAGIWQALLHILIVITAWIGLILGTIGGIGLLYRRLADEEMRRYSSFADYFNILFILLFFLSALVVTLLSDPSLTGAKAYVYGLLSGGLPLNGYAPGQSFFGGLAIVSASLLAAYIPLTHMSHMFMKYFLYHQVKWDDAPNRRGGSIEAAFSRNLELKPTWKAKHMGADGRKSWRDIASSTPKESK